MPSYAPSVRQPAAMMMFDSIEALMPLVNNFYLMFLDMGEEYKEIFRHFPAFLRFRDNFPERVTELEKALEADGRFPGENSWPLLLEAYRLMAVLVDLDDTNVIPPPHLPYPEIDPTTGIDPLYLTR